MVGDSEFGLLAPWYSAPNESHFGLPSAALPAGIVRIELDSPDNVPARAVDVGGAVASIMVASPRALTIRIPETAGHGIAVHNHAVARAELNVGRAIASDLQPVSNPVLDAFGNVYVTYSGTRGEKVPFSVFVVYADGSKHPFLADIINPTGLAIGPDDFLYISSRHTGSIYRSTFDRQVEKFADGLGLASGLVFSPRATSMSATEVDSSTGSHRNGKPRSCVSWSRVSPPTIWRGAR